MAKEICISSTPHETRLAILEDDQLSEIYYERENEYTLAGSIYNGRVTRVLPGMQSAFVDLGLERDAFLYVTDFVELEDQEDSDEIEKAAATGANVAPREIRRTSEPDQAAKGGRPDERGSRSGRDDRQRDGRGDRQQRDRRPTEEAAQDSGSAAAAEPPSVPEIEEAGDEAADGQGARRWRGRRHRRGGRGSAGQGARTPAESSSEEQAAEPVSEPAAGSMYTTDIQAGEWRQPAPTHRAAAAPEAFLLPGESLKKYGGTGADETPKPAAETNAPPRPAPTFKPSTLVEAPLSWDGSGLLPGESLARHRSRPAEPEAEAALDGSPEAVWEAQSGDEASAATEDEILEEELGIPAGESAPPALHEIESAPHQTTHLEENRVAAEILALRSEEDPVADDEFFEEEVQSPHGAEAHSSEDRPEEDASASHRIDPASPSGFRLFGFGGKKRTEDEPAPAAETPAPAHAAPAAVSTYAPGEGLIEEEVIEGEEFDATPHGRRAKSDEHDLDDYEEETLPTQMRSGDLGEMLQEAHLDHKIQLNFDGANGDDEEGFDIEEEGEEEPSAEAQPAAPGQQRRDRNGRGRNGRGDRQGNRRGGPSRRSAQTSDLPIISDLLKPGQEILVQIAKEPIAKKGARITSHIALPGRFLVFMPTVTHVGVSRKIASDEERHRLKRILVNERGESSGGFIVRTAAEGASEDELRADLRFLMNLWNDIKQRSESSKSPALIYHDLSLIERILRDQVSANFSNIWVDSEADYERIVRFLNRFSPSLVRRVKLYTKETPLFEHFGIQDEISKALRSKVWLKSGGSIVINQTEALVAIDINTGKYVGKSARLEDTILKTNLDAVPEIVRQIRLRDLGGIIVIDFIDMDERKNRFKVMAALEEALKSDRAPTKVLQFNDFGLVAITRKRVKQSLERTLSVPCPTCQATGMVKSPATVCNEVYIELRKMRKHFEGADVMIRVHPETVKILKSNNARWLNEFEELVGKNILLKSDATLHPEQFDIQG
jgi:Rne/Rng family ribonuclease